MSLSFPLTYCFSHWNSFPIPQLISTANVTFSSFSSGQTIYFPCSSHVCLVLCVRVLAHICLCESCLTFPLQLSILSRVTLIIIPTIFYSQRLFQELHPIADLLSFWLSSVMSHLPWQMRSFS